MRKGTNIKWKEIQSNFLFVRSKKLLEDGNYQIQQGRNQKYYGNTNGYGCMWAGCYLFCTGAGQSIQFGNLCGYNAENYFSFALTHCGDGFRLKLNQCNKFLGKDLKFNVDNGTDDTTKFEFEIRLDGGVMVRAKENGTLLSSIPLYFDRIN